MLAPAGTVPRGLFSCAVGGERYAIDLAAVVAIERVSELLPPESEGAGGVGLLRAQGEGAEPTPVVRLGTLLGTPRPSHPTAGAILVVERGGKRLGLLVDRVERVPHADAAEFLAMPRLAGERARRMFRGLFRRGETLELVLDLSFWILSPAASQAVAAHPADSPTAAQPEREPAPRPPRTAKTARLALFSTAPSGEAPVLFALSLTQVREVLQARPLLRVPGASAHLLGLTLWRDQALPVLDLALRMGGGPSLFEGESRLLVARGASSTESLGLPVRPDIRFLTLPQPGRASAQARLLDRRLVRGVFELEEGTVFIPDVDLFLTSD